MIIDVEKCLGNTAWPVMNQGRGHFELIGDHKTICRHGRRKFASKHTIGSSWQGLRQFQHHRSVSRSRGGLHARGHHRHSSSSSSSSSGGIGPGLDLQRPCSKRAPLRGHRNGSPAPPSTLAGAARRSPPTPRSSSAGWCFRNIL